MKVWVISPGQELQTTVVFAEGKGNMEEAVNEGSYKNSYNHVEMRTVIVMIYSF